MRAAELGTADPHPARAAAQLRERGDGAGVATAGHPRIADDSQPVTSRYGLWRGGTGVLAIPVRKAADDAVALAHLNIPPVHLLPSFVQSFDVVDRCNFNRRPGDASIWGQRNGLITGHSHSPTSHLESVPKRPKNSQPVSTFKMQQNPSVKKSMQHWRLRGTPLPAGISQQMGEKSDRLRAYAQSCLSVLRSMTLLSDRARLKELADEAIAEADRSEKHEGIATQQQQQQPQQPPKKEDC